MANVNRSKLTTNYADFDFTEFTEFVESFSIKTYNFKKWVRRWCDKKAREVLSKAVARTPWDTGYLATSWREPQIQILGNEVNIYFINDAYYAGWVEYGHATPHHAGESPGGPHWVEGRFMLTVPLQEFVDAMPADFEEGFFEYMSKLEEKGTI